MTIKSTPYIPVDPGHPVKDVPEYLRPTSIPLSMPSNPKQICGDAKVPLHLVPPALSIYVAIGLSEGVEKFGAWNWRSNPVQVMTYVAAIRRHLDDFVDGTDIDPDSTIGKPSLAGVGASLGILIDAIEGGFAIDNRPPKGPAQALFKKWTKGKA